MIQIQFKLIQSKIFKHQIIWFEAAINFAVKMLNILKLVEVMIASYVDMPLGVRGEIRNNDQSLRFSKVSAFPLRMLFSRLTSLPTK